MTNDVIKDLENGTVVDEKSADLIAEDGDKFHVAWVDEANDTVFVVEYIPENYPWLTVYVDDLKTYIENIAVVDWIINNVNEEEFERLANKVGYSGNTNKEEEFVEEPEEDFEF